jgi:cytochrome c oxidase assembly factor CtaG
VPAMSPVPFTLHNALTRWDWSPFPLVVLAALILVGWWYLRADWNLAMRGRRWHGVRTASFLAGLVAVDLALQSPVATMTMFYFQAHVVQHLLLMIIAPPLLALGAPSTLLLQTASRRVKTRWLGVLRARPFAVLTHPISVWSLYFGTMFAFFLSPLINVAMNHMALMDAFNVLFLLGGLLFWWPLVGIDPMIHWKMSYGIRLLTLLIGSGVETFLGVALLGSSKPAASMYTVASTHAGAGLLWSSAEVATFVGLVPIFVQWVRSEERAGVRADAQASRVTPAARQDAPTAASHLTARPKMTAWEAAWMAKTGTQPEMLGARATPGLDVGA